ncbi:Chalcone--flavonone isomerase [Quillaja saponaria]|uniref:Chalcone-flavonone isomerase family protein n=1 Tax=Quillaja saponaria TaxID=32244 RepID=A0AAD7PY58_QUISA|nr:Chalcone--flavonone isomerase [Quillaja saponaria]
MALTPSSVTGIQVDNVEFPPTVKPPGSIKTLFLGGAGVRGLLIDGNFVHFTAIGVYLEDNAVPSLAVKWKGKSAEELTESVEFFNDIIRGPFERFIRVTFLKQLTGEQFTVNLSKTLVANWKSAGIYTELEGKAIEKFLAAFKDQIFLPGSFVMFTLSPNKPLTITLSKDGSIPEAGTAVIETKLLGEAFLESVIGENGVSPGAKQSLAERLSVLFKDEKVAKEEKPEVVEAQST